MLTKDLLPPEIHSAENEGSGAHSSVVPSRGRRVTTALMARRQRITLGGCVTHVPNRANGRLRIFRKAGDVLAFEQILAEAIEIGSEPLRSNRMLCYH